MNLLALEKSNTIPHKGLWGPSSFVRHTTVDLVYKSAIKYISTHNVRHL